MRLFYNTSAKYSHLPFAEAVADADVSRGYNKSDADADANEDADIRLITI